MAPILLNSLTARPLKIMHVMKNPNSLGDGNASQNIVSRQIIVSRIYFLRFWVIVCIQKCNSSSTIYDVLLAKNAQKG